MCHFHVRRIRFAFCSMFLCGTCIYIQLYLYTCKKNFFRITILSHFLFSLRFMLFPTFLEENKLFRGGGGGGINKANSD